MTEFNADRYNELVYEYENAIQEGDAELAAAIAATFREEFKCEIEYQF